GGAHAQAHANPRTIGQDELRAFDQYVERAVRDWNVPGLAIALVHGDPMIFARGYGVREVGRPDRVDEHTRFAIRSQEHTSELQSRENLVCRLLLEKKKIKINSWCL